MKGKIVQKTDKGFVGKEQLKEYLIENPLTAPSRLGAMINSAITYWPMHSC